MKLPRFGIAWLMVIVAMAALNLGAIRGWSVFSGPDADTNYALILGGLPMANVLAIGFLIWRRRPGSRPFLLGFEVVGATALTLYCAATFLLTWVWLKPYLYLVLEPLFKSFGNTFAPAQFLILYTVVAVMLGLPQLAIALIGGFLFRRFRIAARPEAPAP